uniref:Uncharacterized protein n=1 Tax=Glossina morsitans morsitans TaxID=37546 RepID=A0A1B0FCF7_GLOMM
CTNCGLVPEDCLIVSEVQFADAGFGTATIDRLVSAESTGSATNYGYGKFQVGAGAEITIKKTRKRRTHLCRHLRLRDAVHFIEIWGNKSNNLLYLQKSVCLQRLYTVPILYLSFIAEPDFPYLQVLAPLQPLAMKTFYCPIDTSLKYRQAPGHPRSIYKNDKKITTFKCDEIIRLPLKKTLDRV